MTRGRQHGPIARLRRHPTAFGAVLAATIAAVTVLAVMSTNGVPLLSSYEVVGDLAPGAPALRAGSDVRVAGQLSGRVTAVERGPRGGQRVRLSLRDDPVGRDARLTVRMRAPAGQHYLELDRGDYRRRPLPSGATLRRAGGGHTDDLIAVVEGFDRRALANARRTIRLTGTGVAGQGAAVNRAADQLDLTLARTAGLLRAAAPGTKLAAVVRQGGLVAAALQGRQAGDSGRVITATAHLLTALSDPRSRVGRTLRELPGTERAVQTAVPDVDPLLERTTVLARRARPAVRELHRALPEVNRLLAQGPRLRAEVRALAPAAGGALRPLRPVLRRAGPSAVLLGRALTPLGDFSARLSRYGRVLESGLLGYYVASLYHPQVGRGAGKPIAPALTVLTCAPGANADPKPDDFFTDHLEQPCR